jgi:hypothetical protein
MAGLRERGEGRQAALGGFTRDAVVWGQANEMPPVAQSGRKVKCAGAGGGVALTTSDVTVI